MPAHACIHRRTQTQTRMHKHTCKQGDAPQGSCPLSMARLRRRAVHNFEGTPKLTRAASAAETSCAQAGDAERGAVLDVVAHVADSAHYAGKHWLTAEGPCGCALAHLAGSVHYAVSAARHVRMPHTAWQPRIVQQGIQLKKRLRKGGCPGLACKWSEDCTQAWSEDCTQAWSKACTQVSSGIEDFTQPKLSCTEWRQGKRSEDKKSYRAAGSCRRCKQRGCDQPFWQRSFHHGHVLQCLIGARSE